MSIFFAFFGFILIFQNCVGQFKPADVSQAQVDFASSVPCTPQSTIACIDKNGSGSQTCNVNGVGYASCVLNACNAGYNLQNNTCVSNSCVPFANHFCSDANGSGNEVCDAQGASYGACELSSCDAGYNLQNGNCVANSCVPGVQAACQNSTNTGSGLMTCNVQGSGYGVCQLNSCAPGFNLNNGVCVANLCTPNTQTQACLFGNGSGTQTCNASGTGFGACVLSACNSGYYLANATCEADACTPNTQTKTCSAGSGTGIMTCNAQGSGFGSCILNSCSTGFTLQGGVCVASCGFNNQIITSGSSVQAYVSKVAPYGMSCSTLKVNLTCNNGTMSSDNPNVPISQLLPNCTDAVAAGTNCFSNGVNCNSVLIMNGSTAQCMDVSAGTVIMNNCNGSPNQTWNIVATQAGHIIKNNNLNTCVFPAGPPHSAGNDGTPDSQLAMSACDSTSAAQNWNILENTNWSAPKYIVNGATVTTGFQGFYNVSNLFSQSSTANCIYLYSPGVEGPCFSPATPDDGLIELVNLPQ